MVKLSEVFQKAVEDARLKDLRLPDGTMLDAKEAATSIEILTNLMRRENSVSGTPKVLMSEALHSTDASILFPRVISDVLIRAREPMMIGQTLLSKTVAIDNVKSVEFPVMGAIRAKDMSETQEYPEQLPSFTENIITVTTTKSGLKISIAEEVIEGSMWDILALYVEQAGFAMIRHKEEKIFNTFKANGQKVFDNTSTNPAAWTHGRAYNQAYNFSVTFDDFIDAMGALVNNEYIPTDIIMHPIAWSVFAKDPIIRNVMYTQGQIGQSVWTTKPDFDQTANVPWNIAYQVTPFVGITNGALSTGPASGLGASFYSDIYVIDRQNSCVVLQRTPLETEEWNDPSRDVRSMKIRERYGVGSLNGGKASAVIANARLVQNFAPINFYATVTPA